MDSNSIPSSDETPQSQASVQSSNRMKTYITWKYVTEVDDGLGTHKLKVCVFCGKGFRGGGINRMKQHLAGIRGQVASRLKVPADVRCIMKNAYDESVQAPKGISVEIDEGQTTTSQQARVKRKVCSTSKSPLENNYNACQPSIKSVWNSKERVHDTNLVVAIWFYHSCIPMNAANSPYFPIAMSKVDSMGHGYTGPSYNALRVTLLKDAKASVGLIIEGQRRMWSETGCTIMSDGWCDSRQRPLINFLVYCPRGISFVKSVDASDIESNAENLCNLFSDIVELVGYRNIVHLVTDNAANYKAAGRLLCEKYPLLTWSPCAAHCINLILKDISEIPSMADLVQLASRITVFIYNHKWPLNWLRKRPGWTEIIRPGATRFGTTFIALKSLHDHKDDLVALVTSNDFKKVLKLPKAKEVKATILTERFWNNCLISVKVMAPILKLLRICDYDEQPSLGYVFEGMTRARNGIEELFRRKKKHCEVYTKILDSRWDRMLRRSLHAAAYWLNPIFQYDSENAVEKSYAFTSVLDMIEQKTHLDPLKLTSQLREFRDRQGQFGRPSALPGVKKNPPDEWWRLYGGDVPELREFAIIILSQTASSSGCERNWSVFERIHTKRRNRLEHQRLHDLVYVHYNLSLQDRTNAKKRIYDPVDYESIDKTDFWIIDEEAEGELDYDELESMLEEEPPSNNGASTSQTHDEDYALNDEVIELDDIVEDIVEEDNDNDDFDAL